MRRVEFTPKARRDLEDIWDYSHDRFGFEKAETYMRNIQRVAETIADDPRRAQACDDIRAGYRKFSLGAHVLFLRASENSVVIVRILHQSMDLKTPVDAALQQGLCRLARLRRDERSRLPGVGPHTPRAREDPSRLGR